VNVFFNNPVVTQGDGMVLVLIEEGTVGAQVTSVFDNQGNEWLHVSDAFSASDVPTSKMSDIWYCKSAKASGVLTIAITSVPVNITANTLSFYYQLQGSIDLDIAGNRTGAGIVGAAAVIESATITPSDSNTSRFFAAVVGQTNLNFLSAYTVNAPWVPLDNYVHSNDEGPGAYAITTGEMSLSVFYTLQSWHSTSNTFWVSSIVAFVSITTGPCPGPPPPVGNPSVRGCEGN